MVKRIEKKALDYCVRNNQRYTKPRKLVLNVLANSKKPIGQLPEKQA